VLRIFNCYNLGGRIGFAAYGKEGTSSGRAFDTVIVLRFRVIGNAGERISLSSDEIVLTFDDGCRKVDFTDFSSQITEPEYGEFKISVANGNNFVFREDIREYTVILPYNSSIADVSVVRPQGSTVLVEGTVLPRSGEGMAVVSYTSPEGEKSFYTLHLYREGEPEFDTNCHLSVLEAEGFDIDPVFSPEVREYRVTVPYGTKKINLHCIAQISEARVLIGDTNIDGERDIITVTVVAPGGETLVYTITVEVLPLEDSSQDSSHVPDESIDESLWESVDASSEEESNPSQNAVESAESQGEQKSLSASLIVFVAIGVCVVSAGLAVVFKRNK